MITLKNKQNNQKIGNITDDQLQFLMNQLEEEHSHDQDYYLSRDTLEVLKENGADSQLINLLTEALGSNEDLDIIWDKSA